MGQTDHGWDGVLGELGSMPGYRCGEGCELELLFGGHRINADGLRLPHSISRLLDVYRDKMAAVFVGLCQSASGPPMAWQLCICVSQ